MRTDVLLVDQFVVQKCVILYVCILHCRNLVSTYKFAMNTLDAFQFVRHILDSLHLDGLYFRRTLFQTEDSLDELIFRRNCFQTELNLGRIFFRLITFQTKKCLDGFEFRLIFLGGFMLGGSHLDGSHQTLVSTLTNQQR